MLFFFVRSNSGKGESGFATSPVFMKFSSKNDTFLQIWKQNREEVQNWWSVVGRRPRTFFFIHFFLFQPNSRDLRSAFGLALLEINQLAINMDTCPNKVRQIFVLKTKKKVFFHDFLKT